MSHIQAPDDRADRIHDHHSVTTSRAGGPTQHVVWGPTQHGPFFYYTIWLRWVYRLLCYRIQASLDTHNKYVHNNNVGSTPDSAQLSGGPARRAPGHCDTFYVFDWIRIFLAL